MAIPKEVYDRVNQAYRDFVTEINAARPTYVDCQANQDAMRKFGMDSVPPIPFESLQQQFVWTALWAATRAAGLIEVEPPTDLEIAEAKKQAQIDRAKRLNARDREDGSYENNKYEARETVAESLMRLGKERVEREKKALIEMKARMQQEGSKVELRAVDYRNQLLSENLSVDSIRVWMKETPADMVRAARALNDFELGHRIDQVLKGRPDPGPRPKE